MKDPDLRRLLDGAQDDTRLVVHNVPVINNEGGVTWPAKYAFTDEEAARTGKVSLEDKKRHVGSVVLSAEMLNHSVDRETAIFKREWFQYRPYEDLEHRPSRSVLTRHKEITIAAEDLGAYGQSFILTLKNRNTDTAAPATTPCGATHERTAPTSRRTTRQILDGTQARQLVDDQGNVRAPGKPGTKDPCIVRNLNGCGSYGSGRIVVFVGIG